MSKKTIPASDEAWDNGSLGADEAFVKVVDESLEEAINEAAGTQLISIRLQKTMIEDFKILAELNGEMGYQTLMKQILQRFVDCEKKRIYQELVTEKLRDKRAQEAQGREPERKTRPRKAA